MPSAKPTVIGPPTTAKGDPSSKVPRNMPDQVTDERRRPTYGKNRDTGFPEPLCLVRNTTLPHPDADLSPNASLSQDDISLQPSIKRNRLSFLKNKHRHTLSHGTVSSTAAALHSVISTTHINTEAKAARINSSSSQAMSRTDGESIASDKRENNDVKGDDTPPTSPEDATPQKRRRFFGRQTD